MAKALTLPAMPDMNPAISAVMPKPEQARAAIARQHQRQHFVVTVQARACTALSGTRLKGSSAKPSNPGRITMSGTTILKYEAMIGASLRRAQILCGHRALHHQEVRRPVAEGDGAAEAEDDAGPVHAHGIAGEVPSVLHKMRVVALCTRWWILATQPAPSAGFDHAQDRDRSARPAR